MRTLLTAVALIAGTLVPAIAVSPAGAAPATPSAATPAAAPAPGGGVGIRLVDAPTDAKDDPRAHVYIIDHLKPAAAIHRRIEVSNGTANTVQVALYAAAAAITGGSFVGAAGHTANELSTWTSVQPGTFQLPPGGKQMATVTITVPRDAAPGEQYGVVWSEVRSAPQQGAGVTQVSRVGIRLYIDVGPGGPPAANFTIDSLTAARTAGGQPMVSATVHNTGGRAIDLSGTIQLSNGPGALNAGPFPMKLGTTVGIGDTETTSAVLDTTLPAGPWTAKITLHSGLLEITEQGTITFPAAGQAAPVKAFPSPTTTSLPGWVLPGIIAVALLLLATLALLLTLTLRARRNTTRAPRAATPPRVQQSRPLTHRHRLGAGTKVAPDSLRQPEIPEA